MNSIERIAKLSGIYTITEVFGEKKYADCDKAGLQAVKKKLQGIMATTARASFKYKNAAEELKLVDECLQKLDKSEKKEVKESEETGVVEPVLETKDDDEKEDKKDSDKDDDEKEDKKDDEKEDKKDSDKDDDEKDKSDDKEDDEKTVKVEVKVEEAEESVEDIVARILEKDLTPTKGEVDYENGPTENSGIKFEQGTKIRLPAAVKAEVKQRIAELNQAILRYDDKGYDDKSIKQQAVDCLNQILQDLSTNDLEGVKKAQIYFETLMSPLTDFFPPKLINWLANAVNPYVGDAENA